MFFFFPIGGGGGGFIFALIMTVLVFRVFRNLFGSSSREYSSGYTYRFVPQNRNFYEGAFSMLAKIAYADGSMTPTVERKVNQFMLQDLAMDSQSYRYARQIFDTAAHDSRSFESICDRFFPAFVGNPGVLQTLIDTFYRIATDDGRLSKNEERMLNYAAMRFQIPRGIIDSIKRKYGIGSTVSTSGNYAVLGLSENASETEIKKAYRKLIMEFHPDSVSSKDGVSEEFKQYATRRFREIQEAYEQICRERGIK